MEHMKSTLNLLIPTRSAKEWRNANKEYIRSYMALYSQENRKHLSEYMALNYQKNKDHYAFRMAIYNQKNKEKIKERMSRKVQCECGVMSRYTDLKRHQKTKKHATLLATLLANQNL
jgi:hypothetical protein